MTSAAKVEEELAQATKRILESDAPKKLVVAGPGTGKTYLFKELLKARPGEADRRLAVTFINALKRDLARSLDGLACAKTLHGYCLSLLKRKPQIRSGLTEAFVLQPGLASLVKTDWAHLRGSDSPRFVEQMRQLNGTDISFYLDRSNYYDAVDYDDCVYRVYSAWRNSPALVEEWELLLVDEFQDFNPLEAGVILEMSEQSDTVIVGDDDQALYSRLRSASWDALRGLHASDGFETFELPFSMRCTEVITGAVADIVTKAQELGYLQGRIQKPYRFYPPKKGADSERYPFLELVRTSVQSKKSNYWGRYIQQQLAIIPQEEIVEAEADGDPTVLVIGPRHYLAAIEDHLVDAGFTVDSGRGVKQPLDMVTGLRLLKANGSSNLGWRIVLEFQDPEFAAPLIVGAHDDGLPLHEVLPREFAEATLSTANDLGEEEDGATETEEEHTGLWVKLVTFESSKGLAAQHVFIAGAHDGDLPRNPTAVDDIEICKFLVAVTRARKKCYLLSTKRFAGTEVKTLSSFLSWIDSARINRVDVTKAYWL